LITVTGGVEKYQVRASTRQQVGKIPRRRIGLQAMDCCASQMGGEEPFQLIEQRSVRTDG
jgi:hypothetical protein